MALRDAGVLARARENFVRKRREMAEQMIPPGAAAGHFAPSFTELQAAIEAIDRAIADEKSLPEHYGQAHAPAGSDDAPSNVEHVDFDSK
jgi:hypothetical protein